MKQQGLFDEFNYNDYSDKLGQPQKRGSRNDIFTDYDSFVAKFSKEAPKTTDDCFTPPAVYQAVLDWLGTKVDLTGKDIIRPFYPGGDYQATEYTENSVVVDNPPFSILAQIVDFYLTKGVKFLLFAPFLTLFAYCKRPLTMIVVGGGIVYANGANVNTGFLSNMFPDIKAMADYDLHKRLMAAQGIKKKNKTTTYNWHRNTVRMSDLEMCVKRKANLIIKNNECVPMKNIGFLKDIKKSVIGGLILVNDRVCEKFDTILGFHKGGQKRPDAIDIELTPSEWEIIKRLNEIADEKDTTGF